MRQILPTASVPIGPLAKGSAAMPINDLPALSILRTKMQWHQERQRVLAENVSNSNTPNFKPRDLIEPKFEVGSGKVDGGAATLHLLKTAIGKG
jgi:flagellar basal-body rod protein FlgB